MSVETPVGPVLAIGHPANNVTWFRTKAGWVDTLGRAVDVSPGTDARDLLDHGAFDLLRLGNGR